MRWRVAEIFTDEFAKILESKLVHQVAIVGGYESDPEVKTIRALCPDAQIQFFGIDKLDGIKYLDLNSTTQTSFSNMFDVVICSQVIEHIWNTSNFFEILNELTAKDGVLWISCPYSNIAHGSPDYYSAGYTPEFLTNNLDRFGWVILIAKQFGSRRSYISTHLYATWLSRDEFLHPLLRYGFQPGTVMGVSLKFMREIPARIHLSFLKKQLTSDSRWATETVVMARKV